jgi:ATP/maltotriose-dependent transcriptional regulator MalT
MLGVSHHLVGDQAAAQCHCERGFRLATARNLVQINFFGYDHRVRALVALARALWLRGLPGRALEFAHQVIDEAAGREHPVNFCIAFIYAIPVFIWTGDFDEADALIKRLIAHASKNSLGPYHAVGLALKGELAVARGETADGVQLLRRALATLRAERHHILAAGFSRALAEGLASSGHYDEATATIAGAMELAEQSGESFDLPDLLRAHAEILMAGPQPDVAAAETLLVRSLECAAKQFAFAWQVRSAIALARLWIQQGRVEDARELLADLHQQLPVTYLSLSRYLMDVEALFTDLQR